MVQTQTIGVLDNHTLPAAMPLVSLSFSLYISIFLSHSVDLCVFALCASPKAAVCVLEVGNIPQTCLVLVLCDGLLLCGQREAESRLKG